MVLSHGYVVAILLLLNFYITTALFAKFVQSLCQGQSQFGLAVWFSSIFAKANIRNIDCCTIAVARCRRGVAVDLLQLLHILLGAEYARYHKLGLRLRLLLEGISQVIK